MMKFFRAMAVIVLACLLCTVSILPAFAETAQESPRLTPGPADYVITEESGGEFRPLPIDMTGGAPLGRVPYSADMNIFQDPTIRVERHRVPNGTAPTTTPLSRSRILPSCVPPPVTTPSAPPPRSR